MEIDGTRPVNYPAACWASMITATILSAADTKTVSSWARSVGKSATIVKLRCRAAGLTAKVSLDFARIARAYVLREVYGGDLVEYVDVGDPRTLRRLLGQFGCRTEQGATTAAEFFRQTQSVVPGACLDSLLDALEHNCVVPPSLAEWARARASDATTAADTRLGDMGSGVKRQR